MIREATKNDAQTIAGMAILMWDSHAVEDLADEFVKILSRDDAQIFLKYENDIPVGFAQCQSATWRGSLSVKTAATGDMLGNCWVHASHGQEKKDARNLPATARSIMLAAFVFIWR